MMKNIAGYRFVTLTDLESLRLSLLDKCRSLSLKGTILLSHEGINISLAGTETAIASFALFIDEDARFHNMTYRESFSATQPFKHMRVKLKKEIITMGCPEVKPELSPAPSISPKDFKHWLDEKKDITILDTRNDYEVRFGAFTKAKHFGLKDFGEFPEQARQLEKNKPIVMYCTGGIRCEKAAVQLLQEGFNEVYQLEGGILNYFAEVGGEHYSGDCFVFDQRIALNPQLQESGTTQCQVCQGPVVPEQICHH